MHMSATPLKPLMGDVITLIITIDECSFYISPTNVIK